MKLNNTQIANSKAGMTLLELTVVILVLLSLISILFVGARAWKKGSDRSANIMNIRNTQQAMRGDQNMKQLEVGADFVEADLTEYLKFPSDVAGGDSGVLGAEGGVSYEAGLTITGESAVPAVDMDHIWLGVSILGLPGATYGHNVYNDITGW